MNLVSTHLHPPAGAPIGTAPRRSVALRVVRRRSRLEPLHRHDPLDRPSELAMRSVHGVHGLHR